MRVKFNISETLQYLIFAAKDGVVTSIGLIAGAAMANSTLTDIVRYTMILMAVLAASVTMRSIISDLREEISLKTSSLNNVLMVIVYFVVGMGLLVPFWLFSPGVALVMSMVISLFALFLIGFVGHNEDQQIARRVGVENVLIGGVTCFIGILFGILFK